MITIIDSGIANVGSVVAAFRRIGAATQVTQSAGDVQGAAALVLPGVGAFEHGMESLHSHGLVAPIRESARRGTPILGVCLGMQLLADVGEEFGVNEGLGLVAGSVVRLEPRRSLERVPNIGWCDVRTASRTRLFEGIETGSAFYFVHSYHLRCADAQDSVASIEFGGGSVTAGIERGNIFGAQFHPEKSQDAGLAMLHNYARIVGEVRI